MYAHYVLLKQNLIFLSAAINLFCSLVLHLITNTVARLQPSDL
jgi:hypothetical protein